MIDRTEKFYTPQKIGWLLTEYFSLRTGLVPGRVTKDWITPLRKIGAQKMPGEEASIIKADIDWALRRLGNQRLVVILAYIVGWTDMEIGDMLGITHHAIQMRRYRALGKMAEILGFRNGN